MNVVRFRCVLLLRMVLFLMICFVVVGSDFCFGMRCCGVIVVFFGFVNSG